MTKVKAVITIISCVMVAYLILLMAWSTVMGNFQATGATLAARPGIEKYIGTLSALAWLPWALWFLPAILGIIALVIVLKRQGEE